MLADGSSVSPSLVLSKAARTVLKCIIYGEERGTDVSGTNHRTRTYLGEGVDALVGERLHGSVGGLGIGTPKELVLLKRFDDELHAVALRPGLYLRHGVDGGEFLPLLVRFVYLSFVRTDVRLDAVREIPLEHQDGLSRHWVQPVIVGGHGEEELSQVVSERADSGARLEDVEPVRLDEEGLQGDGRDDVGPVPTLGMGSRVPTETGHDEQPLASADGGAMLLVVVAELHEPVVGPPLVGEPDRVPSEGTDLLFDGGHVVRDVRDQVAGQRLLVERVQLVLLDGLTFPPGRGLVAPHDDAFVRGLVELLELRKVELVHDVAREAGAVHLNLDVRYASREIGEEEQKYLKRSTDRSVSARCVSFDPTRV